MLIKFFKLVLIFLFFQNPLYSKNKSFNDFNLDHLSNYFSGIVAYDNNDNSEALKYFRSSKSLIKQHNSYLEKYVYSLVVEGKVPQATNEIKQNFTKNNSNFFEAHLLLALDSLKKNKYKQSREHLERAYPFVQNNKISLVIVETLKEYLHVFEKKELPNSKKKFGNFSFTNEVLQRCFLNDKKTNNYFENLINNENEPNYSRYIFFYVNYLVENDRYAEAKTITDNIDYLDSTILISQVVLFLCPLQLLRMVNSITKMVLQQQYLKCQKT